MPIGGFLWDWDWEIGPTGLGAGTVRPVVRGSSERRPLLDGGMSQVICAGALFLIRFS